LDVLIRIRPKEIAEKTSVGDISRSHDSLNLLERAKLWAETTMHAKNFFINNCSNRKTVEAISESLPQLDIVATLALIIETIDSVDRCTFVISSQQEEVLGIFNFVSEKEAHCLE